MNLIEKLGIKKARAIVNGAPEWADTFCISSDDYFRADGSEIKCCIFLKDLRTAIADHDQYWYGQSEEKELEQYAILSQEKIEGGAVFVGDNSAIVQAMRNITDDCTDIRNHISPWLAGRNI